MNCELADVQAGFRKGKRTRDRFGSWKKQKSSRKTSPSALSITPKPLIHCVDHNKLWKILSRDGNSRPPDLPPEKSVCQSRSNSYNWTWNNRLVLNQDGVCQGCILSPYWFNLYAVYIMRNAGLGEAQAGIKIARRNNNNLRYADDTTLMAESEELKSLLMKVRGEWKSWPKAQHSEN